MNILITGSSGYIGSHLVKLLRTNHNVTGLDIASPKVIPTKWDNVDITGSYLYITSFDCVIHLAALTKVSASVHSPLPYYKTNFNGTLNLLNSIPCKHFIFASTGAAEHCQSPYAVSKRAAEDCIIEHCKNRKMNYTIFRFYNVIGNSVIGTTNNDALFYNLEQAIQTKTFNLYGNDYKTPDGTAIRDYVHVDEICGSIEYALTNPSMSIENLGHGVGYSVLEIVEQFKKSNNVDFEINYCDRRPGDVERSVLSESSKYMKTIYTIEEMLRIKNDKPV